jgi:hypothetical protein
MNKFHNFLKAAINYILVAILFALLGANFLSSASATNLVEQQKALRDATSGLLSVHVKDVKYSVMRMSTLGILAELSARVEHLRDLEELMAIATPETKEILKLKIDKLRRYDFGYACAINLNNIDVFVAAVREAELATSLKSSKRVVLSVCETEKSQ